MGGRSPSSNRRFRRASSPSVRSREDVAWHTLTAPDVLKRLRVGSDGLTEEAAAVRLGAAGPNLLPEGRRAGPLPLLWHQLLSPFVLVLLVAAGISVVVHHYLTAFVIAVAVAVNVVIGFMQEFKAERALTSLKNLHAPKAVAVRGGMPREIPATELVPGDLVLLDAGDAVPADGRVIDAHGLETEESLLTGESLPVPKTTEPALHGDAP
ncbi:MAG: HAD-IC family P-type ATPase, partial [Euryarchaeota archaeon]|nr:HAD-IC family P-type ATPase [Euryarchaeota archaeon]